jgi:hypothetical protein
MTASQAKDSRCDRHARLRLEHRRKRLEKRYRRLLAGRTALNRIRRARRFRPWRAIRAGVTPSPW